MTPIHVQFIQISLSPKGGKLLFLQYKNNPKQNKNHFATMKFSFVLGSIQVAPCVHLIFSI